MKKLGLLWETFVLTVTAALMATMGCASANGDEWVEGEGAEVPVSELPQEEQEARAEELMSRLAPGGDLWERMQPKQSLPEGDLGTLEQPLSSDIIAIPDPGDLIYTWGLWTSPSGGSQLQANGHAVSGNNTLVDTYWHAVAPGLYKGGARWVHGGSTVISVYEPSDPPQCPTRYLDYTFYSTADDSWEHDAPYRIAVPGGKWYDNGLPKCRYSKAVQAEVAKWMHTGPRRDCKCEMPYYTNGAVFFKADDAYFDCTFYPGCTVGPEGVQ